jgi:hypothetical protein
MYENESGEMMLKVICSVLDRDTHWKEASRKKPLEDGRQQKSNVLNNVMMCV